MKAKPFLKWAGGKSQLICDIESRIPLKFKTNKFTYIEPFLGGGAVLFHLLKTYPNIEKAIINDINSDLINTYLNVRDDVGKLVYILSKFEEQYCSVYLNKAKKEEYYYKKRDLFNSRSADKTTQSALFIFLNKTCFNGLYRVNKQGLFNVPVGSFKSTPNICDELNLVKCSKLLAKVEILNVDYLDTLKYVPHNNTLFYLDPPYKGVSPTSNFNSYSKNKFNDTDQLNLKLFCDNLNKLNCSWILSNSDLKNTDNNNSYFDILYKQYKIERVSARRCINSKSYRRGSIKELLISNC